MNTWNGSPQRKLITNTLSGNSGQINPHRRPRARTVAVRAHHQLPQRHDLRPAPAGHRPRRELAGLRCITEHVTPGQWDYARQPSRKELAAVRLLALSLDEASVKIRTGPPGGGDSPDAALGPVGRRPAAGRDMAATHPRPSPLPPGIPLPARPAGEPGRSQDGWTATGGSLAPHVPYLRGRAGRGRLRAGPGDFSGCS